MAATSQYKAVTQHQAIFAKWDNSPAYDNAYVLELNPLPSFSLQQSNGEIRTVTSPVALAVNAWSFLAAVADGTNLYLYVNG